MIEKRKVKIKNDQGKVIFELKARAAKEKFDEEKNFIIDLTYIKLKNSIQSNKDFHLYCYNRGIKLDTHNQVDFHIEQQCLRDYVKYIFSKPELSQEIVDALLIQEMYGIFVDVYKSSINHQGFDCNVDDSFIPFFLSGIPEIPLIIFDGDETVDFLINKLSGNEELCDDFHIEHFFQGASCFGGLNYHVYESGMVDQRLWPELEQEIQLMDNGKALFSLPKWLEQYIRYEICYSRSSYYPSSQLDHVFISLKLLEMLEDIKSSDFTLEDYKDKLLEHYSPKDSFMDAHEKVFNKGQSLTRTLVSQSNTALVKASNSLNSQAFFSENSQDSSDVNIAQNGVESCESIDGSVHQTVSSGVANDSNFTEFNSDGDPKLVL